MNRVHLVLVPGFAGFDALGQLEYYAGVTTLFQKWREPAPGARAGTRAVLHYFDNFPTAGVCTRAVRLRQYLAKRVARGEFAPGDEVVLVGHSTGGLDIRRLIWDLAAEKAPMTRVDGGGKPVAGGRESSVPVAAEGLMGLIKRVAFISVPHWGTNIADWVRARRGERWVAVNDLRAMLFATHLPVLDRLEEMVAGVAALAADSDVLLAAHDVLAEADSFTGKPGPLRTADAHESAAMVELWLRHMASDFSAIDDLAAQPADGDRGSPAHFSRDSRVKEIDLWNGPANQARIHTRSYVTLAKRPYHFDAPEPRAWDFLQPGTYPDLSSGESSRRTDLTYRLCYRACAGGPFKPPQIGRPCITYLDPAHQDLVERWTGGEVTAWDNDGIVNTASMVWRDREDVVVVPGDHMDVVGHYRRVKAEAANGREYQAYDLLGSASQFDETTFEQVWNNLLAWAVQPEAPRADEVPRPASTLLRVLDGAVIV